MTPHNRCRVSPFGHPRINAQLATPRGITQPHTSFIGSACQGIHHAPLTNKHKNLFRQHTQKITQKEQKKTHTNHTHHHTGGRCQSMKCSRPLYSSHTTHPTTRKPPHKPHQGGSHYRAATDGTVHGNTQRVVPDTRQHANAPFNYLSPPPPGVNTPHTVNTVREASTADKNMWQVHTRQPQPHPTPAGKLPDPWGKKYLKSP